MNRTPFKNGESFFCASELECSALRKLIELDGWPVYEDPVAYREWEYCGIFQGEFMGLGKPKTPLSASEALFRGAPEWATLVVKGCTGMFVWVEHNRKGERTRIKFFGESEASLTVQDHGWYRAEVVARRSNLLTSLAEQLARLTEEQLDELEKEVVRLKTPTKLEDLLKPGEYSIVTGSDIHNFECYSPGYSFQTCSSAKRVLADRIPRNHLEAWVAQEAPDWDGTNGWEAYLDEDKEYQFIEGNAASLGTILMPKELAELLCSKLNSGEWVL